ncbi:hypothetical protein FACS1894201_03010 [Bacteroidia bacterium]|nr:hypothetical protein FACS1894201_03010 [Bacteroidia bacterium]
MNNKCPVCDTEYSQADLQFCPECCWELVFIPSDSSDSLKAWFEKKRIVFENALNDLRDAERTIKEKAVATAKLEKDKKQLLTEIEKIEGEIDKLKKEWEELNQKTPVNNERLRELEKLEKELPKIIQEITQLTNSLPDGFNLTDLNDLESLTELNRIFSQY